MSSFNSVLYFTLGQRIKDRREELNYSQQQLAEIVSNIYQLKRSSISNIERGKQQPPLHIIYEICKALKLDVQSILPTYSDVQQKVNVVNESTLENYINKYDVDEKTRKEINSTIQQFKK